MSSRSSSSVSCRRSQTSAMPRRSPARPARIRIEASVTSRAKRSGRIAVSGRGRAVAVGRRGGTLRVRRVLRPLGQLAVTRDEQVEAALELAGELGGREHVGMLAEPQHPGDQLALVRVLGGEEPVAASPRSRVISPKRPKWRSSCHAMRSATRISAVAMTSPNCHGPSSA